MRYLAFGDRLLNRGRKLALPAKLCSISVSVLSFRGVS
jgi:hypothetical protein